MNRNPSVRDPALVRGARVSATRFLAAGTGTASIGSGGGEMPVVPAARCFLYSGPKFEPRMLIEFGAH
jgi:hypothetical protein